MKILLAGAGGHDVAAIVGKDLTPRDSAKGLAEGKELIVYSAGASVSKDAPDKCPYSAVETAIHRNLILEAKGCGIKRFVHFGVHTRPYYADCHYSIAHEAKLAMLADGEMDFIVIRPTGIHKVFAELLPFARKCVLPLDGDGASKTNSIDPQDLAETLVERLKEGPNDIPCGGPEVLTRRQINGVIAKAAGKEMVFMAKLPAWSPPQVPSRRPSASEA